jgi:zinc protease
VAQKTALEKVRTLYDVEEYRLPNGLRVLYKEVNAAPVVAVCVTFHVGSRNEAKGHTGSTHILEHLLFKDSKNFNKKNGKAITDYLEWFGAYINATTWLDRTNYFELLPKDKLAEALELEADRMRGSLFTDKDLKSEMTVVRNEYERSRNNPFELLDEEVMATAITTHPYRIPTIGTKEDIEASTAKKLREFYNTFYWPNNATLSVLGDVPFSKAKPLIEKYFGPIPASPNPIPTLMVEEPEQQEPRSTEVKKEVGFSIVEFAYKIPEGRHPDFAAILALSIILAGGFSSRLKSSLVDKGLATDVFAFAMPLHDPGVMTITTHLTPGIDPVKVATLLRKDVIGLSKSISKQELSRAQERIYSLFSAERDGVFNEIRALSEAIAAGEWTLAYSLEENVKKLKTADLVRVAKKYLRKESETVGMLKG